MHLEESFYEFFIELSLNNHKTWFDANRKRYETDVKKPFQALVQEVIERVSAVDSRFSGLTPSDCIFRINKDIRFSKDKSPYKTFCSAAIQIGGRKQMSAGGLYFEMGPENCGVYAGVYMPEKEMLMQIRENIAGRLMDFSKTVNHKDFKQYFGGVLGEKNKILPPHLKEAAAQQPLIFNKQFYVQHSMEAEDTLAGDLAGKITRVWQVSIPFAKMLAGE